MMLPSLLVCVSECTISIIVNNGRGKDVLLDYHKIGDTRTVGLLEETVF